MSIKLTGEAEKERLRNRSLPKWGLFSSISLVKALHFARDNGWADKKVQVRFEKIGTDIVNYIVEPYEEGCSCRSLLRYSDYFEMEEEHGI